MVDGVRTPFVLELDSTLTVVAEYEDVPHCASATDDGREDVLARAVAKWAVEAVKENPIPGTDDLRAEFFEARTRLLQLHEIAGTVCPDCEMGSLLRQYKEKLRSDGLLDRIP
jgi:hypothetical protein